MHQIESFLLGEMCICISQIEHIRILPGINLIDERTYEKLMAHPSFLEYMQSKILEEVHIDETEFIIDPDTNITILNNSEEKVPIQNVMINSESKPLAMSGITITSREAKKAGLSDDLALRISKFMPSTGWVSIQQIREKLNLDDSVNLNKLPFPVVDQPA